MCTYLTEKIGVDGSGKGAKGWFGATEATVYVDHPVHALYGHTVNIDVLNSSAGSVGAGGAGVDRGDRAGAGGRDSPRRRVGTTGVGVAGPVALSGAGRFPPSAAGSRAAQRRCAAAGPDR